MAEQIETDLWRLDIPLVGNPLKNLNSYLIAGERNLLIDTGFSPGPLPGGHDPPASGDRCGSGQNRYFSDLTVTVTTRAWHRSWFVLAAAFISAMVDLPGLEDAMSEDRWRALYRDYERNRFPFGGDCLPLAQQSCPKRRGGSLGPISVYSSGGWGGAGLRLPPPALHADTGAYPWAPVPV